MSSNIEVKKEIDMLSGPILPQMLRFSLPVILSGILQQLYNTADTLIVGAMGGKEALAAVGATISTVSLLVNVFTSIFIGTNILAARAKGAKDDDAIQKIVSTTYILSLIIGVGIMILGESLAETMMILTDCPTHIIDQSVLYLRIYFLGMPASIFMNFGASVIRSLGDSRSPFIYMSISGIVNVVCNVIFVLLFGNPVAAVAVATVLSMYVSATFFLIHMIKEKGSAKLYPFRFSFHIPTFVKTIRYGIPAAISSSTFALTNIIIQPTVNSYGDIGISGTAASGAIESYIYVITSAIGGAVSTFMGQNIGAKNKQRVKRVLLNGYALNIAIMAVFSAIALSLGKILLGLFIPGEEAAIDFGYIRLCMIAGAAVLNATMNVNSGALQAYGYTFMQMISNLVGVCLFRIIWMWLIYPLNPTPLNFLICYPISWAFSASALLIVVVFLTKKYLKGKEFKL